MATKTYQVQAWNLDELFSSFEDPQIEATIERVETNVQALEALRPELSSETSGQTLRQFLDGYEGISRQLSRLAAYAGLRFSADTQDQRAQTFQARMRQLMAEVDNRTLFFKLWWKALADEEAERLLSEAGDYVYWLEALRLQKPYTLTEPEEKIINLKDVNGPHALVTLYASITNRYVFRLDVDGEEREFTRGQLSTYVMGPNPDLRAGAYQEMYRVYGDEAPVLGQIYQAIVRDWHSEQVQLRGFDNPIAVRNLANHVPDEVVDTLLDVCQANAPLFQRYFQLKAEWLGMDKLRRYDVYAPVAEADVDYPYQEAIDRIMASFEEFDPQVAALATRVLDEDHIDSQVRKGKRDGAFCATVTPDLTPYVLANYQGKARDVATIAHELGHAVHSLLASDHNALTQSSSLPLAETASTFSEMLLVDRMLSQDPNPAVQRDLILRQLDDNYATIMRQAYFAMFEKTAHQAIRQGASVDDLSGLYLENLTGQFGGTLELADEFRYEWVSIPHFYNSPFYVYAYAFGQLLVLSLYQRYQQEGDSFKPAYLDILRAGGSAAPMDILDRAGVDVRRASFWQGGFDVIAATMRRLEALQVPS